MWFSTALELSLILPFQNKAQCLHPMEKEFMRLERKLGFIWMSELSASSNLKPDSVFQILVTSRAKSC